MLARGSDDLVGFAQERNASLVGAQVLTYTEGGSDVTIETIDREVTPRFSEAALETLAASGAASVDEWKAGLLESARAVKGMRDGFAAPIELSDESYVELTDPTDGVYVTSLASGAVSIDFTVECSGLDEVTGSIRAVSGDELVAVPLLCVPDEEGEGLPAKAAQEYCPAA